MLEYTEITSFLSLLATHPLIDVRAPGEYSQGHIPGAYNVPVFDDCERKIVGTLYRQQGRQPSLLKGLEIAGPKLSSITETACRIVQGKPTTAGTSDVNHVSNTPKSNRILVHCWRGGMRSRCVAWLLELADLHPIVLFGGYKSYRRQMLASFQRPWKFVVLSGLTGAGKTIQLRALNRAGQQVIDLESLAGHRGSAFGGIGMPAQPTTEHFENTLFDTLRKLDHSLPIWVEDESHNIGAVQIPFQIFRRIRAAPAIFIDVPRERRIQRITQEYGSLPADELLAAICRISKRLGGQNMRVAARALQTGDLTECVSILLNYYDKLYLTNKAKLKRNIFEPLSIVDASSIDTTQQLIQFAKRLETAADG